MSNNDDINLKIQTMKEHLYTIHKELLAEIKGKPFEQIKEDYNEGFQSIRIPKLIENIKETIQLLLEKRIEDFKTSMINTKTVVNKINFKEYESQLRQYEDTIRKQYKREIVAKINLGVSKHRLDCYEPMEDEFEEMKEKLKYEDGQFLNNDRKDNEILILRAENSNLKEGTQRCQDKKKETKSRISKNKDRIAKLKAKIDKLSKTLEKNQIQIDSKSNSSINININNGHSAAKWVIKRQEENQIMSSNTSMKNKRIIEEGGKNEPFDLERCPLEAKLRQIHNNAKKIRKEKSAIVDMNAILNKYNSYLNDYEDKSANVSQVKAILKKNNTIGINNRKKEVMSFNGCSVNSPAISPNISKNQSNNYVKIANLIPLASKIPSSSRMQNHQIANTMNKKYVINNTGNKTTNKFSLNLRAKFN